MQATGLHSAVRVVQMFLLVSGVCLAVDLDITYHNRNTDCGQNVTLTCAATSTKQLEIKFFTWMFKSKDMCNETEPEVQCNQTENTLSLELFNVMPVDAGIYICKIRAMQGAKAKPINITVEECRGSSDSTTNATTARCSFSGVYPSGVVHWLQEDANLTTAARTEEKMDQEGRYDIWSTMDAKEGNKSQPFNCSLWIPSLGKYLSSQQVRVGSSGHLVALRWICVVLEIITLSFIV
ncbi:uncharacterized protein LOC124997959 [Mugil cephalus]|uniref:uncharacterized protein LOC124997959 n=1 Tax=Mugil cephalus TaxID=48193 RepID=UPI001FB5BA15|nr:uncharacterized protein LOC124997959 [Mugil cephalus]